MPEIYVSTDIETDGPIPGPHSMLSFGSAAFLPDKTLLDTFTVNLKTLAGAKGHPITMKWWHKSNKTAYKATRINPVSPEIAMHNYTTWVKKLPGTPVFVGYPVVFDFMFINWYLMKYVGENPFGHSALDIKTYAMALLKSDFSQAAKRKMPERWFDSFKNTHIALDDAIEQGQLFCNMLMENR